MPVNKTSETNKAIYDQDCEFYRYQDSLKWKSFQILAIIEGTAILGFTQLKLDATVRGALLIVGSLFVLLISIMIERDEYDALSHLDRIKKFEELGNHPFVHSESRFVRAFPKGKWLIRTGLLLLNLFNLAACLNYF